MLLTTSHDWTNDLVAALAKRASANGGPVKRDDRFLEGDSNIVTSYGLLALHAARTEGGITGRMPSDREASAPAPASCTLSMPKEDDDVP